MWHTLVCLSLFCISRGKKTKKILLERGKFSFLYVDIWFDVMKCKCIVKNNSFEMFVMFSPIFVADTKITFVYKFVAPLNTNIRYYWSLKILHMLYQRISSSYWAILPSIFMMLSLVSMSLCWNPYLLAINKSIFFILNYLYVYLFPYIPKFNSFFFFFFCTSCIFCIFFHFDGQLRTNIMI